jgi:hypothetical protein
MTTFDAGSMCCSACSAIKARSANEKPVEFLCLKFALRPRPDAAAGRHRADAVVLDQSRQRMARRMIEFEYP